MTKDQLIEWLNSMAGVCHGEGAWRDSDDDTLNELVARITPDPNSVPSAAEKPSDHADEGSRTVAGGAEPLRAALLRIAQCKYDGVHDTDTVMASIAQQALGLPMDLLGITDEPEKKP